eukprot:TRINITY_DN705_c0_g1_i1.p1 TRINITY_DN705_c0_g1~~TRINITY_DN705_c0_g1_i1.p1  ORF type:complete len:187 (+),score=24.71 TRINITY_DN705_c0_g1_i1:155-715(+)
MKRRRGEVETFNGNADTFELLPDEIVELILLRLAARDIVAVGACCQRLQRLASSDAFWRRVYHNQFPRGRSSSGGLEWRHVYARAMRSLPKGFNQLEPLGISGRFRAMAFDRDRRRLLVADIANFSNRLRLFALDCGAELASVELDAGLIILQLFVNAAFGSYVVVCHRSEPPGYTVQVLDATVHC